MDWNSINPASWFPAASTAETVRQPTIFAYMPMPSEELRQLKPVETAEFWIAWQQLESQLKNAQAEFDRFGEEITTEVVDIVVQAAEKRDRFNSLDALLVGRFLDSDSDQERKRLALQEALEKVNSYRTGSPMVRERYLATAMAFILPAYSGGFDAEKFREDAAAVLGDVDERKEKRTRVLAKLAKAKRDLASHIKSVSGCFVGDVPEHYRGSDGGGDYRGVRMDQENPRTIAETFIAEFVAAWKLAARSHGVPVDINGREIAKMFDPRSAKAGYEVLGLGALEKKASLFRPRVTQADHGPAQAA